MGRRAGDAHAARMQYWERVQTLELAQHPAAPRLAWPEDLTLVAHQQQLVVARAGMERTLYGLFEEIRGLESRCFLREAACAETEQRLGKERSVSSRLSLLLHAARALLDACRDRHALGRAVGVAARDLLAADAAAPRCEQLRRLLARPLIVPAVATAVSAQTLQGLDSLNNEYVVLRDLSGVPQGLAAHASSVWVLPQQKDGETVSLLALRADWDSQMLE